MTRTLAPCTISMCLSTSLLEAIWTPSRRNALGASIDIIAWPASPLLLVKAVLKSDTCACSSTSGGMLFWILRPSLRVGSARRESTRKSAALVAMILLGEGTTQACTTLVVIM